MNQPLTAQIRNAADSIRRGGLVAMPTETVYGLAADATNDDAVAGIYEVKGRPQFNPLIVHVADAEMARRYVVFSPLAKTLSDAFWPGPLTLVLPRLQPSPRAQATAGISPGEDTQPVSKASGSHRHAPKQLSLLVSAGLDTVAVRAPDHPVAQALLRAADRPLAAPSANRSGAVSPTTAQHVRESLGARVDMILDGGPCPVGVESTIVKIDGDDAVLLRPGGAARADIERIVGKGLKSPAAATDKPEAPGMLASHYAPHARLRLNARRPRAGEAFLAFGPAPDGGAVLNLSAAGNVREAAANLFAHLRALDALCAERGLEGIAAAPVPDEGLGEAVNDRLRRAAAPRN
ncbi:MAG: L-threonylcarbamoyladenylate synthase [Hyphococcus sp.]